MYSKPPFRVLSLLNLLLIILFSFVIVNLISTKTQAKSRNALSQSMVVAM